MPERAEIVRVGRQDVKITHPGKVLFPPDGITKRDLFDYYERIASWMLPHLRERPLSLGRYPDGIQQPAIIQQAASRYFPAWIKTATMKKVGGGTVKHVVCDDDATLVYLANQACITPHSWLSRRDKPNYPDQMVFDLDPSGDDFETVRATASPCAIAYGNCSCPPISKQAVRASTLWCL